MPSKVTFIGSRILTNNWVVTLTATLVGVFAALYVNEWVASKKLRNQKAIATQNILAEISSNNEDLHLTILKHAELLETMTFLGKYVDEESRLIAPPDSLDKFRAKYPALVLIEDSTQLENGYYEYDGEINLDLTFPQFNLSTIAWETLKNSGISATYGFECLLYLETVDKITQEVLQKNRELLEYFTGAKESGEENENLLNHLELLIDYEESLQEVYQGSERALENCG